MKKSSAPIPNWPDYYRSRVNNPTSLAAFDKKYGPFLDTIAAAKPDILLEAGAGIGTATKLLMKSGLGVSHTLVDSDPAMLALALQHHKDARMYLRLVVQNLLEPYRKDIVPALTLADVVHSQGVLEHFSDSEIKTIIDQQLKISPCLIHCVPSHRYTEKSFGNERLLTPHEWREIANPSRILEFNDGYELVLLFIRGAR